MRDNAIRGGRGLSLSYTRSGHFSANGFEILQVQNYYEITTSMYDQAKLNSDFISKDKERFQSCFYDLKSRP